MRIDIKARITGSVLFSFEAEINNIRITLEAAVKARANLADANLAGANLAGANLARANLARADLADANLARADLADANLARANLARADLADADLAGANLARANLARADLAGANLARANLADANLAGANLAGANLADANLADANLAGANLAGAEGLEPASDEEIARLDEVREIVLRTPDRLDMGQWHSGNWDASHTPEEEHKCGSAHCIAGWLQALSPDVELRQKAAVEAGVILAPASKYMFYASDRVALQWLKDRGYARHKVAA